MRVGLSIISGLMICFAAWFAWEASTLPESMTLGAPGPGRIPMIAAMMIGGFAALLLVQELRSKDRTSVPYPQQPRVAIMGGAGVVYAILIPVLGYYLATPVFMLPVLVLLRTSWRAAMGVTAGFTAFVFLVFDQLLNVPLP